MPNDIYVNNVLASGSDHEASSSISSDRSVSPLDVEDVSTTSLLVRFAEGTTAEEVSVLEKRYGYVVDKYWSQFGMAKLRIPTRGVSASSADAIHRLDAHRRMLEDQPEILDAGYNYVIQVPEKQQGQYTDDARNVSERSDHILTPDDPLFAEQWGASRIGVVSSWEICQGNPSVVIALIDSGYDTDHPDISVDSLWVNEIEQNGIAGVDDDLNGFVDDINGWDWIENDRIPNDELGHGTHVGGTIRAVTNNGEGISGAAPNVSIMPLRILREDGKGEIADLIDALAYALRKGVRIANLSLVSYYNAPALEQAVEIAHEKGMLMVAATGNLATRVYWPAAYPETLAVTATTEGDIMGGFSNFGKEVDIAAPGVDILSTYFGGEYFKTSGTSMATPYVSALAALILSLRPDYSLDDIVSTIKDTAEDIDEDPQFVGAGLVDFQNALWTASKDLLLASPEENQTTVFAESPVTINYRVTTPSEDRLRVHGASVHYQLVSASANSSEIHSESYEESDHEGIATFKFDAPSLSGDYLIKIRVGATDQVLLPLFVQTHPDSIAFQTSPILKVDDSTRLRLEIRNAAGELLSGLTPVEIETTSGTLPPGSRTNVGMAIDGEYVFRFQSDTKVGTSIITATVGNLTITTEVKVVAGEPDAINCPDIPSLDPYHNIESVSFSCFVVDAHDNLVQDGIEVSSTPSQLASTQDGQVQIFVDIPEDDGPHAISEIRIPNTNVSKIILVPVYGHHSWMPIIYGR